MSRTPLVAGNWKLNKTRAEAAEMIQGLAKAIDGVTGVDVLLCTPFTALETALKAAEGSAIQIGAQNVFYENKGAFTGEISAPMLKDLGLPYVIVGHSERRAYFGDTDEVVAKKLRAALSVGIKPIVCVGETLDQREAGDAKSVVEGQVKAALEGLNDSEIAQVVIAYEPVWAIGTGKTATPAQAQEMHAMIRGLLTELFGGTQAAAQIILYGGSVKPANAQELFAQADIDGGLVGGASLTAENFGPIVKAAV